MDFIAIKSIRGTKSSKINHKPGCINAWCNILHKILLLYPFQWWRLEKHKNERKMSFDDQNRRSNENFIRIITDHLI
jgi:hypothetical protein